MKAFRWLGIIVGVALLVAIAFGGLIFGASESGEVVVLTSRDSSGVEHQTRLWVVEDGGYEWLRCGVPDSGWCVRLRDSPGVTVERSGRTQSFTAVAVTDAATRDRIHALMAEKYGLAETVVASIRDGDLSVPFRLEPAPN